MNMDIKLDKDKELQLKKAQRMLHDLLPSVDKLEACGDNCEEIRDTINSQAAKIEAILKHFGNNIQG